MNYTKTTGRIPRNIKFARGIICHRQFGFDRVRFAIDHASPELPLDKLKAECGDAVLKLAAKQYAPRMQSLLELFQPSVEALRILNDALGGLPYNIEIDYIEPACDFITRKKRDAKDLETWVLARAVVPSWQQRVIREENIFYFGRRSDKTGKKKPKNLVIYADNPSKLAGPWKGRACAHIEFRFASIGHIRKLGILTVADLIGFDHLDFWEREVKLVRWSKKTELGAAVTQGSVDVSGTALRKQADAFISEYKIAGRFVLQNAIIEQRELAAILLPIESKLIFGE